jgi:hypothetical protein
LAEGELSVKVGFQFFDLATDQTLACGVVRGGLGKASGLGHFQKTAQSIQRQTAFGEEVLKHDYKVSNAVFCGVLQRF